SALRMRAHIVQRPLGQGEDPLGPIEHDLPGRRQRRPSCRALAQSGAAEPVEVAQVVVDRGLTPPQLLGRAGDRARLGHGGQSLQLTKIEHAPILRRPNTALHIVYGANQRSGGFPRPLPSVTMALCSNRFWTHRTASDTVASNSIRIRLPMPLP